MKETTYNISLTETQINTLIEAISTSYPDLAIDISAQVGFQMRVNDAVAEEVAAEIEAETETTRPFTVEELAGAAIAATYKDDCFEDILGDSWDGLDYLNLSDLQVELTSCDFEVYGHATFGACEGIYADVYIDYPGKSPITICTLKALDTSKQTFLKMQTITGLISWHVTDIVNHNIRRFPE